MIKMPSRGILRKGLLRRLHVTPGGSRAAACSPCPAVKPDSPGAWFRLAAGQGPRESHTTVRGRRGEESELKSAPTFLSCCNPRDQTGEVGLRGRKTGPRIVAALTDRAARYVCVCGRAAHTCHACPAPAWPRVHLSRAVGLGGAHSGSTAC